MKTKSHPQAKDILNPKQISPRNQPQDTLVSLQFFHQDLKFSTPFIRFNYFKPKTTFFENMGNREKISCLSRFKIPLPTNNIDNLFVSKLELADKLVIKHVQGKFPDFKRTGSGAHLSL